MRIAFVGPIAEPGRPAKGGVESGTREIINCLAAAGTETLEYPYPAPDRYWSKARKALFYALNLPFVTIRVILNARRYDVLHLTSLYRSYLYPELLIACLVRLQKRAVVVHLRPGDWWRQYEERSPVYQFCFRRLVKVASIVLVESENLMAVARSLQIAPVLIPSFVVEEPLPRTPEAPDALLSLAYAGSLIHEKGLETILEVRRLLADRGVHTRLHLIGNGDANYLDQLKSSWPEDDVIWHGEVAHPDVRRQLRAAHFFCFPTRFIGEGHANALNEAMAEGLVPIVSDHASNADVVGEAGKVLPLGADADAYADAIMDVRNEGWLTYSRRASERIRAHFWAPTVMDKLKAAYRDVAARR